MEDGLTLALHRDEFYDVAAGDLTLLQEVVRALAKRLRALVAERPEEPTSQPPLDSDVLAELRAMAGEDDPEFLPGLLEQFFHDTPALLGETRKAVERGDTHTLELTAHCLKGSCRNLGANPMAHLCAQLEEYGRAGSPHGAMILLKQLEHELERVQHALESLRLGGT
jgi:HPt (histidine-containing phosphotransfer) domain-containing protein